MKRFSKLIALIAIAGAKPLMPLTISAGVTNVGVFAYDHDHIDITPKEFSYGNKVLMSTNERLFDTNDDWSGSTFLIYDGDFQVIKTFSTEFSKVSYNTNWGTKTKYANTEGICIRYDNNCYPEEIYLTQTLFNNDEAYEWIETKLSVIDTEYGQNAVVSGFKVLSDNGNVIIDEDFENYNYLSNTANAMCIIPTDSGVYMLVSIDYYGNDEYYGDVEEKTLIYKIEPESASVKQVAVHRNIRVNPSAPHRGTAVNVDLGEPVGNNTKLSVVNMSGRTVVTQNLTPGSTEAVIDTYRFESGVYVVVLNNGETDRETTKIVVR